MTVQITYGTANSTREYCAMMLLACSHEFTCSLSAQVNKRKCATHVFSNVTKGHTNVNTREHLHSLHG